MFFALCFFLAIEVSAQKIIMEKILLVEGAMEVYYTLDDTNDSQEYQVDLYSSKDNFAVPLTKVSGDVGTEIKPGEFHMIRWNAFEEIGGYEGELFLEIRARVYIPFVRITGFNEGAKFKRGRTYPLLWTSGNKGGQIDIELYKDQSRVSGDRNVPNSGKYEYAIPGSVKPGKNYQLKFTNTRNRDESTYTGYFRIIPRIPVVAKIGVLAVVATGLALLIPGPDTTTPQQELEGPPGFPDN
jgi:hypothetical protein